MVKQLTLYVLTLLHVSTLISQGDWDLILPPSPTSNQLVSLDFIDETTGWAVGEYGTILKSTDAGENWRLIEIPQLNYLTDVYFPTAATGYIVGKDGTILKSVDGGESWFQQTIRFTNNLHRVRFRDENTGWVIGEKGLILHTRDGGINWEQQTSNSRVDLNGLALIGQNGICTVGKDSTILISRDSGQSWRKIQLSLEKYSSEPILNFNDVYFLDTQQGWIGGSIGSMTISGISLFTNNGGETWEEIKTEDTEYKSYRSGSSGLLDGIQQIYFLDSLNGFFLSDKVIPQFSFFPTTTNIPYVTASGGKFWSSRVLGTADSFARAGRLAVLKNDHVICTGFGGEFRHLTDNGTTWRYPNARMRDFYEIQTVDHGKIIGLRSTQDRNFLSDIYTWQFSNDYGQRWQSFMPQFLDKQQKIIENLNLYNPGTYFSATETLRSICVLNPQQRAVFESSDFGQTWHLVHSNGNTAFSNPHFLTADTLIQYRMLMVETGKDEYAAEITFLNSFDCGQTVSTNKFQDVWNQIVPYDPLNWNQSRKFISKHYFLNGHTGFLIGSEGNIIKTTNTGQSWENIPSGVVDDLWDITFVNRQTGFVVGDFGRILKTTDGGQTWRKTDSGTQEDVYSIGFKNETEGWAGTETGLRYTRDGGETWQGVPLRYFHGPVREIEFDQDGTGYAYTYKFYSYESTNNWNSRPGGYFLLLVLKEGGVVVENTPATSPYQFTLSQNYPNPFNSTTHIRFSLPENESVSLKIYNIQGQLVRTLLDEVRKAGEHSVVWDGTTNAGQLVASGVYFLRLIQGEQVRMRKILVLK